MVIECEELKGYIAFPCCPSQKKMVYVSGRGKVADKCPKCGKFAIFDLDEMKAELTKPFRGVVSKFNNSVYRPSR